MDAVTKAEQWGNIQFVDEASEDGWDSCYPGQTFTPIHNDNLKRYTSTVKMNGKDYHPVIYDLPVDTAGDGGLFQDMTDGTLAYVRLSGASIAAGGYAGGLVGVTAGDTSILGCQVLLSPARGQLDGKTEQDAWITGASAGGLVGCAQGKLTVEESFAATVVRGTEYAGGLVGRAEGTVSAGHSYADCYLYGDTTGGLAAAGAISLKNCYAVGFQEGNVTAGLIPGELTAGENVYTACARLESGGLTYSTAADGGSLSGVYYLGGGETNLAGTESADYSQWSGDKRENAVKLLGTAFTADTSGSQTVAYNLVEGMGLGDYSYPRLTDLPHYGDWQAEFESGALVYYEVYKTAAGATAYGFRGANMSTLTDSHTVLGDGYGVIFAGYPVENVSVTYGSGTDRKTVSLGGTSAIDMGDGYYLLPLPSDAVNVTAKPKGFYYDIQVGGTGYYYNPHFAARITTGTEAPAAPDQVPIRTARQLNNLSVYYDAYSPYLGADCVFLQERGIDYTAYQWGKYGANGAVKSQAPIGKSPSAPFAHTYNGGCYPIRGLSFLCEGADAYVGMFGYNTGALRNIVLTESSTTRQTVSYPNGVQGKDGGAGILVGWNNGTVYNCAAAGYTVTGYAYSASTLYVGGLAGYNDANGVSAPVIRTVSTYARLGVGGFVGGNAGTISQCYAMADAEIVEIRGGGTSLAGFAGENTGAIRLSYCATALSSSGSDTYGFAPSTGSVAQCYYLDGGTYSYASQVSLYGYTDYTRAQGVTDEELIAMASGSLTGFSAVSAAQSYDHPDTLNSDGAAYPYPGSVTDRAGRPVHYGDWVTRADLGHLGMIYWEREQDGANSGYHFSYIGFENGAEKSGSSLCTAHDDNGAVTAYGYGYYWAEGQEEPTLSASTYFKLDGKADDVAALLEKQTPGLRFVVYETGTDGLRLESGTKSNGEWTLTQGGVKYAYQVCPFFADAYNLTSKNAAPGTDDRPYHVRSVSQLQFINWSYVNGTGSTTRDVESGNYRYFPYLQYTYGTYSRRQTKAEAIAGDNVGGPRPIQTWMQSHDLNGADRANAEDGTKNTVLQPIAGAVVNKWDSDNSYSMVLYNWFGGKYDGQSYYIKNVNINSYCCNVGLFGTTAGAEMKNIVLYSDNGGIIQRSTRATPANNASRSKDQYQCSYALGGLVGIAYDYSATMGQGAITNCSIAGYKVWDNSKNYQHLGEAGVGGLVGVSSVTLDRCSAIVDMEINCTHTNTNGVLHACLYGNYVRVGGLVGGARYQVTNCYTGGSITVGADTLKERIPSSDSTNKIFADPMTETQVKWSTNAGRGNTQPETYVYIGGIGGSSFSATFQNFVTGSDSTASVAEYTNCYTYLDFPDMEGTITGISLIGSVADRYARAGSTLTIQNCYYLNSSKEGISFDRLSRLYIRSYQKNWRWTTASLYNILDTQSARDAMLNGDLSYLGDFIGNAAQTSYTINGLTGLSYEQMARRLTGANITTTNNTGAARTYENFKDALGSAFSWVTLEEMGASIHGKYSFPGDTASLKGQDYPFPTILTQTNAFGEEVDLHYGRWPQVGLYWSEGIVNMDLITDYDGEKAISAVTRKLNAVNIGADITKEPTFSYSKDNIVRASLVNTLTDGYTILLEGLEPGSVEVVATLGDYTARMMVNVTAAVNITAAPSMVSQFVGETTPVLLTARNKTGAELTDVKWQVASSDDKVAAVTLSGSVAQVEGRGEGAASLRVTAAYTLPNGKTYQGEMILTAATRQQGVLGIADARGDAPVIVQGTVDRDLTGWETEPAAVSADTAIPSCPGQTYLYSSGTDMELNYFTVTEVSIVNATGGKSDALADGGRYRAWVGQAESVGGGSVLPIVVKGQHQGTVTLSVTLKDNRAGGGTYTLTMPYTLTAADTQVTASFLDAEGNTIFTSTVAYGGKPALPGADILAGLTPPEGYDFLDLTTPEGWEPQANTPLYGDAQFTPGLERRLTTEAAIAGSPANAGDGADT